MKHRSTSPRAPRLPASDLAGFEQAVAGRLAALPRAAAPEALRLRCLGAADAAGVVTPAGVVAPAEVGALIHGPSGGARPLPSLPPSTYRWAWTRVGWPAAAAAALLCLLGVPASSSGPEVGGPTSTGATFVSLRVIDDPSVPLFHSLETFDQLLASRSALASAEPTGSGSGR